MGAIKLGQADSWSAIKMSNKIVIVPCITFFTLLLLIFTMQSSRDNVANLTWAATNQVVEMVTARDDLHDVKNDTLGFSKVFVISMPHRTDKRDAIALAAGVTGFRIDYVDGVDGNAIPDSAIPLGWPENESANTLGCWRAHMNVAQRMVQERIPSALIMEDDADWDVLLKSQLRCFAQGARYLQESDDSPTSVPTDSRNEQSLFNSPYGSDWDLLWLGHCGAVNNASASQRTWVIHEDASAVPHELWPYGRRQPNVSPSEFSGSNFTRYIYEPRHGLCMTGYALSLRGAERLLYHQSLSGSALVSDRALATLCRDRNYGFRCISPYPTFIASHRAAGDTDKDSDRLFGREIREIGYSEGLVFSTRLNMERLLSGEETVISQFPSDTLVSSISRHEELPLGDGVYVRITDFA